jgi:integrase
MAAPVALSVALDEYLLLREGQTAERTYNTERNSLRSFVKWINVNYAKQLDLLCRNLTARHVESFFYDTTHGQVVRVAASTFNTRRTHVNTFVNFMHRRGYVNAGLMDGVKARKIVKRARTRLTVGDLMTLLNSARNPRDRVFVAVAINTALRQNEIRSLRVGDVDLEQGVIHTRLTKNSKEDHFPISADLDAELRTWMMWYQQEVGQLLPDMYLIPSMSKVELNSQGKYEQGLSHPQPYVEYKWVNRMIKNLLAQVIDDTHLEGVHTIRRSVARIYYDMALQEDGSRDDALRITQTVLNHSSVTQTEAYIGLQREKDKRDSSLKGQPFLTKLVGENVVQLRKVE